MKSEFSKRWLKLAQDDLLSAQILKEEGLFTLAAYHLQQTVEKSLKAVIVHKIGYLPKGYKTHNISTLIDLLREHDIKIPNYVQTFEYLTDYAFTTCYPDDYVPVSEEEYEEAYEIAKKVYEWARNTVFHDTQ